MNTLLLPRRGFTLIELLTVITILSLLAAILFPVFARVRESGRRTACASNLRQLSAGFQMYTQDHDETLPPYSYSTGPAGIDGYLGADGARWADLIYPYVRSAAVYDCPDSGVNLAKQNGAQYFDVATYSYGYHGRMFDLPGDEAFGVAGRPLSAVEDAAGTLLLADDLGPGEMNGRIAVDSATPIALLMLQIDGLRHPAARLEDGPEGQSFTAAYVDGHARYTRLMDAYGSAPPYLRAFTVTAD